jgi:hypothetical protein
LSRHPRPRPHPGKKRGWPGRRPAMTSRTGPSPAMTSSKAWMKPSCPACRGLPRACTPDFSISRKSASATFQVHVNLFTYALPHSSYRGAGRITVCNMKPTFQFVAIAAEVMFDVDRELDLLERCASECSLIAESATDRGARWEHQTLASEYREIAEALRSYRGALVVRATRRSAFL